MSEPESARDPDPLRDAVLVTGAPCSGKSCTTRVLSQAPEFVRLPEPLSIWDIGMGRRPDDRRAAVEATPGVRHRILRACAWELANSGKPRYLDELSYHALRIPFVHQVAPHAKIIHVIRDPARAIPEMSHWWNQMSDTLPKAIRRRARQVQLSTLALADNLLGA